MRYYDVQLPLSGKTEDKQSKQIADVFQRLHTSGFKYHSLTTCLTEDDIPDDELIEVYREAIAQFMEEDGYANIEVIHLQNYSRSTGAYVYKPVRDRFETRLITHGKCSLFVQIDAQVFEFQCCQGDLICLPGELCYWFEVGVHACKYIHLYMTEDAWDKPSDRQDIQPCSVIRQAS